MNTSRFGGRDIDRSSFRSKGICERRDIAIVHAEGTYVQTPNDAMDWNRIRGDAVVLHKPKGFVSGQPELIFPAHRKKKHQRQRIHRHPPAVQLLTRANFTHLDDDELKETLSLGTYFHFSTRRKKEHHHHHPPFSSSKIQEKERGNTIGTDATLCGYVPAGRLDLDSTGLLIFVRNGVLAKKLVSSDGLLPKEYIVQAVPIHNHDNINHPNQIRRKGNTRGLPSSQHGNDQLIGRWNIDKGTDPLQFFLRGGNYLQGESRPLKPLEEAQWIDGNLQSGGTLRLVLREGRKRQIRRMCRELLGLHVTHLVRTSIGSEITLDNGDLKEGQWRPLRQCEMKSILFAGER